jgi:hypothetical protein
MVGLNDVFEYLGDKPAMVGLNDVFEYLGDKLVDEFIIDQDVFCRLRSLEALLPLRRRA